MKKEGVGKFFHREYPRLALVELKWLKKGEKRIRDWTI